MRKSKKKKKPISTRLRNILKTLLVFTTEVLLKRYYSNEKTWVVVYDEQTRLSTRTGPGYHNERQNAFINFRLLPC